MEFKKGDILRCINANNQHPDLEAGAFYIASGAEFDVGFIPEIKFIIIGANEFYASRFEKVDPNSLTKLERLVYGI